VILVTQTQVNSRPTLTTMLVCLGSMACHRFPPATSRTELSSSVIFEPGVVSTPLPEFSITFTPDGRTLYFGRASQDRSVLTIMTASYAGGRWTPPQVAPFSGRYHDVDPFVTPGGQRLYFSSDRPRSSTNGHSLSTWYVERTLSGWSEPVDPGEPLNSDSTDVFVSTSRDGILVFGSRREGHSRAYSTHLVNGRWEIPQAIRFGAVLDGVANPLISPSGRFILLVLDQPSRGADLFVSCRTASGWSSPRRLSDEVNSRYADFAPALDPKESSLFFTSERPGIVGPQPDSIRPPGDIYTIPLKAAGIDCA
jgi:WD40 repeat protein